MRGLLVLEADGGLENAEAAALELHLMGCRECRLEQARVREEWAELRATASRFRRASGASDPRPRAAFTTRDTRVLPSRGNGCGLELDALLRGKNGHQLKNGQARNGHVPGANGHGTNGHAPRGVAAQLGRGGPGGRLAKRSVWLLAAAILVAIAAAGWLVAWRAPAAVRLVASVGATVRVASGAVQVGDVLPAGEVVVLSAAALPAGVSAPAGVTIQFGAQGMRLRGEGSLRFDGSQVEVLSGKLRVAADGDLLLHVPGAELKAGAGSDLEISLVPTAADASGAGRDDGRGELHVVHGRVQVVPAGGGVPVSLGADQSYQLANDPNDGDASGRHQSGSPNGSNTQDATSDHGQPQSRSSAHAPRDLIVPADARATGPVLVIAARDQLTNLPVPGVAFALSKAQVSSVGTVEDRLADLPRRAWADAQGWAMVMDLGAGDYRLTAEGPLGYGGKTQQRLAFSGELTVVEVLLNPAIQLRGRLLDRDGEPAADVAIDDTRTDSHGAFTLALDHAEWHDLAVGESRATVAIKATWANAWAERARRATSSHLVPGGWWLVFDDAVGFAIEVDASGDGRAEASHQGD